LAEDGVENMARTDAGRRRSEEHRGECAQPKRPQFCRIVGGLGRIGCLSGKPIARARPGEHQVGDDRRKLPGADPRQVFTLLFRSEAARALARRVNRFNGLSGMRALQASIASKITGTQTAFEVASEALQIFGGNGVTRAYPLEKLLRDARASMIEDGCNEMLAIKGGSLVEMYLGDIIGAITFTGSLIAFGKLQGTISGAPVHFKGQHALNALLGLALLGIGVAFVALQASDPLTATVLFWVASVLAMILGVTLIIPIGGADMPVIVSMLNSYSGWAAAGVGFTLHNQVLIIAGALIGSSGAILSYIMCKAMNRAFLSVLFGGFGTGDAAVAGPAQAARAGATIGAVEDAAFMMTQAQKVIIVPGYGMAVAVAHSRVYDDKHYLSEVILGGAIGWSIGTWIASKDRSAAPAAVTLLPAANGASLAWKF